MSIRFTGRFLEKWESSLVERWVWTIYCYSFMLFCVVCRWLPEVLADFECENGLKIAFLCNTIADQALQYWNISPVHILGGGELVPFFFFFIAQPKVWRGWQLRSLTTPSYTSSVCWMISVWKVTGLYIHGNHVFGPRVTWSLLSTANTIPSSEHFCLGRRHFYLERSHLHFCLIDTFGQFSSICSDCM